MNNIIQIDVIRIERDKQRKCVCKDPHYTVDTKNREITCDCGIAHDPFEVMKELAEHYERINRQHVALNEQAQRWHKEKPWGVLFKRLEQSYQRGTMLPTCPHCDNLFDFKELKFWGNAQFYQYKIKGEEQ